MSPRWASVGSCDLYFYASERHLRPHVDVRGPGFRGTVDVLSGELLSGHIPRRELNRVRGLLRQHRELALEAFHRALQHDFAGTLDEQLEERP